MVAQLISSLSTRTLNHFAQEARLDGESLKDASDRYEIDYAWHVLGSDRLRDETLAALETRLQQAASDAQRACVSDILASAAAQQAPELLMSFDNDVPEQLAQWLCASWGGAVAPA